MRFGPKPQDPYAAHEREAWADMLEATARRREEAAKAARPRLLRRAWTRVWGSRVQLVPVLVVAGLLLAGLVVRAERMPVAAVAGFGLAGLAVYYWWRAVAARRPALAMLRPVLAVAYLVASAVVA